MTESVDAKGKLPAVQFYTKDWREDIGLQSCSLAAQGLWINAMCLMHQATPYGHLMINGRPMTTAQIGRAVGASEKECRHLLDELEHAGVSSVTPDGAIFSRRMVRDNQRREELKEIGRQNGAKGAEHGKKGAEHGAKGGRPRKSETGAETPPSEPGQEPPQNPPSSSPTATPYPIPEKPGGAHPDATTSRAPDAEPEPSKAQPVQGSGTAYGLAALAMRQQGMGDAHPGDPRLRALVDAAVSIEEFQSIAREAVDKAKRFPWALAALANRRAEAAAAPIAAKPAPASTNPDVAATQARLNAEAARAIAKPPAELLARRQARTAGDAS